MTTSQKIIKYLALALAAFLIFTIFSAILGGIYGLVTSLGLVKENKNIEFGICGEQGADLESISFLRNSGIDYVSCSPYRIPIARLGSAKAELTK